MKKILVLSFDDIKGANCAHCMLSFSKGETIVYVDQSSKKYHSKPTCSGMKNAKGIPLSQAKKKYTACKKCCKWG